MLVSIAPTSDALDPDPTWVSLDAQLVSWTVDRGRQFELDQTEAGTATVTFVDTSGRLDPTNISSDLYPNLKPLRQIRIQEVNPVTGETVTQFTGFIEDWSADPEPTEGLLNVTIDCVDGFDMLSNREVVPDSTTGQASYAQQHVDDAQRARLADAFWPSALTNIFEGNVDVLPVIYQAGTDILTTLQDCADAEFPGVGNIFIDRSGVYCFRGRFARFNPDDYTPSDGVRTSSQPMLQWNAGDKAAVAGHDDWAKVAEIELNLDKLRIVNACLATPEGIAAADVNPQLYTDPSSISEFGPRSLKYDGLLTADGASDGNDALTETKLFAQYYVENYKQPHVRVAKLVFKSVDPGDPSNAGTWALICGVEIGDLIFLTVTNVGGGGLIGVGFYVDGIHQTAQIGTDVLQRTCTLDVTPQALYATNPWAGPS